MRGKGDGHTGFQPREIGELDTEGEDANGHSRSWRQLLGSVSDAVVQWGSCRFFGCGGSSMLTKALMFCQCDDDCEKRGNCCSDKAKKFHERFWAPCKAPKILYFLWFSYSAYVFWAPCKAPEGIAY